MPKYRMTGKRQNPLTIDAIFSTTPNPDVAHEFEAASDIAAMQHAQAYLITKPDITELRWDAKSVRVFCGDREITAATCHA